MEDIWNGLTLIPAHLVRQYLERQDWNTVVNAYGPTALLWALYIVALAVILVTISILWRDPKGEEIVSALVFVLILQLALIWICVRGLISPSLALITMIGAVSIFVTQWYIKRAYTVPKHWLEMFAWFRADRTQALMTESGEEIFQRLVRNQEQIQLNQKETKAGVSNDIIDQLPEWLYNTT